MNDENTFKGMETDENDEYIFNEKIDECVFNIIYVIFFGVCPLVLFTLLIKALDGRYNNWAHACIMLCVYPAVYIAYLLIKLITLHSLSLRRKMKNHKGINYENREENCCKQ